MYTLEGFDDAIIGKTNDKVIYDYKKCVEIFMRTESWSEDDSIEWMEYNVVCQDKAIFRQIISVFMYVVFHILH